MSAIGKNQYIASQLDNLPLELIEPIISRLNFRDVIALTKDVQEGTQLWNAFSISPAWRRIWPMLVENRDGFETLISLMITVNGRVLDLSGGALMGTAGKFLRDLRRLQARMPAGTDRELWAPEFFKIMGVRTSGTLAQILAEMGRGHLLFLCQEMSIDAICTLAPWLPRRDLSEPQLRVRFLNFLESTCLCNALRVASDEGGWPGLGRNTVPFEVGPHSEHAAKRCYERHPAQETGNWSIPQIKVFMAAYTEVQTKLNAAKSDQLRDMTKLYERHHSRLREPLAPQTPRKNPKHIPQQLGVTARRVKQIIDMEKVPTVSRIQKSRGTRQGISRFRYPHTCFVPYDWCLELWTRIVVEGMEDVGSELEKDHLHDEEILSLGVGSMSLREEQAAATTTTKTGATQRVRSIERSDVPENIRKSIQLVKRGMGTYFVAEYKGKELGDELVYDEKGKIGFYGLPRTTEGKDGGPAFAVYQEQAWELGGMPWVLLPTKSDEVEWLVAFLETVGWMENRYPEIAAEVKAKVVDEEEKEKEEIVELEESVRGSSTKVVA